MSDRRNDRFTFFTSDLHFGHAKAIEYRNRPYKNVEEMNQKLIKNWNSVVKENNLVIVVGDFQMYLKKDEIRSILSQLNGYKHLVIGNHDHFTEAEWLNMGFHSVSRSMTMKIGKELVNISHYPYRKPWYHVAWFNLKNKLFPKKYFRPKQFSDQLKDDGRFLIHGHTHAKERSSGRSIHVGVDAWQMTPVSLHKIGNLINEIKTGYKQKTDK